MALRPEVSSGTDTSSDSVQGQHFASDGSPVGGEFQINTYTTSHQQGPALSITGGGNFVVVWSSWGSASTDTHHNSIQKAMPPLIFADGFESGDTGAWSAPPS